MHWLIKGRVVYEVVIQHWVVIMASTKRNTLTLEDRVKVVKLSDGGKSARKIADEMGVGRTQIQGIIKHKADVLADYESYNIYCFNKCSMSTIFSFLLFYKQIHVHK